MWRLASYPLGCGARRARARSLLLGLVCLLTFLSSSESSADEVTGTFTGEAALRGNYYYEQSTRVVAPALTMALSSPRGVRADATYLVDAITSASVATGVISDSAFREIRHDFQGGLGHELDLGKVQLDLTVRGRFSKEPDYFSRGVGFSAALSLLERTTVLRLNGYFVHDNVYAVTREVPANQPGGKLRANPRDYKGDLDTLSLGLAVDQVLSPVDTLTVGYDLGILEGFTANPYRKVVNVGGNVDEKHPRLRQRHAGYFWYSHYIKPWRTALRAGYRFYQDDWSITAHAPEGRIYQELGEYVELRLRYRYYRQDDAFFLHQLNPLRTADPKMRAFYDQTFGFKLRLGLGFLERTFLRVFQSAVFDATLEYMQSTSRYGNAWISQGGLVWPF